MLEWIYSSFYPLLQAGVHQVLNHPGFSGLLLQTWRSVRLATVGHLIYSLQS